MGQDHRLAYGVMRATAQQNMAEIEALARRGADITDAVLWKLLPYTDSAAHRAHGAWVTVAPAIRGDLRAWYEAAGWISPGEWPAVARAIYAFVRRCVAVPAELDVACQSFAALPYSKGFQSGMLTPILNALAPDNFHVLNSKSRATLNYFASANFSPSLTDYPAANAKLHDFLARQEKLAQLAADVDMRPGDLFDLFCHWLTAIHRFAFRPQRYWRLRIDDEPGLWAAWQAGRYVAVGSEALGDVTGIPRREFNRRRDSLLAQYPTWTKAGLNLVWDFARKMHEGDQVLVVDEKGVTLGRGSITGPYFYIPEVEDGHRRPVEWEDLTPRQTGLTGSRGLVELDAATFAAAEQAPPYTRPQAPSGEPAAPDASDASRQIAESRPPYAAAKPKRNPAFDLDKLAAATGLAVERLAQWVRAIERKGQAILYGPPGTGKTYVAQQLARHLIGEGDGFCEVIQFHPAYSYEDFVQGIRPQTQHGALSYELLPGRFVSFCRRAVTHRDRCVLIIDEINRANVPQVLGELLYLLEYREASIALAGDDAPFAIPTNVRILGTMNTADRSLALVDHALRRRFAFLPLYPDFDVLRHYHAQAGSDFPVERLIELLTALHEAIGDPNLALGITYFLRPNLAEEMADIWQLEIEPYLEELFFDQPEQVTPFRWANVRGRLGL